MKRRILDYTAGYWKIYLFPFLWWISDWKNYPRMRSRSENQLLEKRLNRWALAISGVVFVVVILMRRIQIDVGIDFSFLPPFHSALNGLAAVALIGAFWSIRNRNVHRHRNFMVAAL